MTEISVVIPCFQCVETIGRAVDSVLAQTLTPSEIILIDDFSLDGTLDELYKLQKKNIGLIKVISLKKNVGAASTRNAGWAASTQTYIAFLDSDDTWHADKLRVQYKYMRENPSVKLSGHLCVLFQRNIVKTSIDNNFDYTNINAHSLLFKNSFSTPTVMLKSDISLRFQDGKRCAEDLLLWQEIAFQGLKVVRIETILAYVHKPLYGASGLSAQLWKMEKGELSNFVVLWSGGRINMFLFAIASFFSLIKFIKRLFFIKVFPLKNYIKESRFS